MLKSRRLLLGATFLAAANSMAAAATVDTRPMTLASAKDQGAVDTATMINLTVHLRLPNRAELENTVDALYTVGAPTFHRWMSDADLRRFAPAAQQVALVARALNRAGLTVTSVSRNGFALHVRGSVGNVSQLFHTAIHTFLLNVKSFRSITGNAVMSGEAGDLVDTVTGLQSHQVNPLLRRATDFRTGLPYAPIPLSVAANGGLSTLITDQILGSPTTVTYTNSGGGLPTATYTGYPYQRTATVVPDFLPKQLQKVYGLDAAYDQGLDGTGQTIVLLEGYGYPTAKQDANAFFAMTGLPKLNSANFQIVYPEGKPADRQAGILAGWNGEIALDLQWAHAMAPGAKIVIVATNGQDNEDFQASMQYIVDNRLGNTVSDSWETDVDALAGPAEQESFEYVLLEAAAKGISFQFSTGDSGDNGFGTPAGAAGVPSVSPHATAVGGTSILNTPSTSDFVPAGWGNILAFVDGGNPVDPPGAFSEIGGGTGGGSSLFWPKPAWQNALPGIYRQTPDISALADPYTGVPFVLYDAHAKKQVVQLGNGGTSLACPIFSAIWAIANQKAGHALGQAAPTIAGLISGVTDVVPRASPDSVQGSVTDSNGTKQYSTRAIFHRTILPNQPPFLAALWDQPQYNQAAAIGFSLDSSLTVGAGWDNQTGYGTPHGLDFINAAAAYK